MCQNLIQSFQAGLQQFRNGGIPRILGNPVTFEEHGAEDAREVVQECDCCGEEIVITSQEATDMNETLGDALQSQPYVAQRNRTMWSAIRRTPSPFHLSIQTKPSNLSMF